MLGCLNVKDSCTIKIKTKDIETCNSLINDILSKRVVWLSSSIYFEENNVIFELDSYINLEIVYVVSIEGDKNNIDMIYTEVNNL